MEKQELKQKIREVVEKSPYRNDIRKVSLFGSYLHGTPRPDSDEDLIVEFKSSAHLSLFDFLDVKFYLEDQLHKEIDLSTPTALSKYIRKKVLREAETIYER